MTRRHLSMLFAVTAIIGLGPLPAELVRHRPAQWTAGPLRVHRTGGPTYKEDGRWRPSRPSSAPTDLRARSF